MFPRLVSFGNTMRESLYLHGVRIVTSQKNSATKSPWKQATREMIRTIEVHINLTFEVCVNPFHWFLPRHTCSQPWIMIKNLTKLTKCFQDTMVSEDSGSDVSGGMIDLQILDLFFFSKTKNNRYPVQWSADVYRI